MKVHKKRIPAEIQLHHIMKSYPLLLGLLLFSSVAGRAEDSGSQTDPFASKGSVRKKADPPPGAGCVGIVENILVPTDLMDGLLFSNSAPADAEAMRTVVQNWVNEGKAVMCATVVCNGTVGRSCGGGSTVEMLYPTEFSPNGPGVWPMPQAFETRNIGYTMEMCTMPDSAGAQISVEHEWKEMHGSNPYHPLIRKTKSETDVFLPVFRTCTTGVRNIAVTSDPFENSGYRPAGPTFPIGKVALLGRFDPPLDGDRHAAMTRLIFARTELAEKSAKAGVLPADFVANIVAVEIPHKDFSAWIQSVKLSSVPDSAWGFVESLRRDNKVSVIEAAGLRCQSGMTNSSERVVEHIYPTEWSAVNRMTVLDTWEERQSAKVNDKEVPGVAGHTSWKIEAVQGLDGASVPKSFLTRNVGGACEIRRIADKTGTVLEIAPERIRVIGNAVHRRVEVDGKWVPDISTPLFLNQRIRTTLRVVPGSWSLVCTEANFSGNGTVDMDHCILTFVKVE